ncbi:MAG: hypothetical protein AAF513_18600 [Pseudomonadota bacterium]
MKLRHLLTTAATAAALLFGASSAWADRYEDHRYNDYRGYKGAYGYDYQRPLKLRMKVRADGNRTFSLRRMLQDRYGINTRDYRIESVAIRNKARHYACADLSVGRRSSGVIDLPRGVTHIYATGRGNGAWKLNVENARVRAITVNLVPKHNAYGGKRYAHNGKRYAQRDYRFRGDDRRYRNTEYGYRQWRYDD